MTASAQPSTVPAHPGAFESPAAMLARKQAEMRQEAARALDGLTSQMSALAEQAAALSELKDIFPQSVLTGLTQFANNTAGSVNIIKSVPPTLKR